MRVRTVMLLIVMLPVVMVGAGALYCWAALHGHG
jgi:hypothetical protein